MQLITRWVRGLMNCARGLFNSSCFSASSVSLLTSSACPAFLACLHSNSLVSDVQHAQMSEALSSVLTEKRTCLVIFKCYIYISNKFNRKQPWLSGLMGRTCSQRTWVQLPWYPYESLVVAGRASGQNCSHVPVKVLPWYLVSWRHEQGSQRC